MSHSDLKNWSIFSVLESTFITEIRMAIVYDKREKKFHLYTGKLGNEALIVTKDDSVYALGGNSSGSLGADDALSTLHPRKIDVLCDKGVKTFAYGSRPHVLALTHKGEIYSWGHDDYSERGNGLPNQGMTLPLVVLNLSKKFMIDIACGSHHSLALTSKGEVYAWGQNKCGQLGIEISSDQGTPQKVNGVLTGKKIVSITCGQTSSIAITDNGEVYSWGCNGVGQLGIGNLSNQFSPCKITGLSGIVIEKVACGYAHTLALSDVGDLYVWGENSYGQLGLGNKSNACGPVKLLSSEMNKASDIAALHYNHISVAVGEGGRVFVWGQCRGQSVTCPTLTPLANLHDALASYATPSVMHQPLELHVNEDMNILDCLNQAFDDPTTSDLIIQVQGKPIHVHKSILKIRSQYFKSMFQEHWKENNQTVLEHDQFSHDVYRSFLKYLYTDKVDLPPENALELLNLVNTYIEPQLKKLCVQIIKRGITVLNAAFLYRTAIDYNAEELEEFCFKFAFNHMTAVTQTPNFAKLDEATIKTFIMKAAKAGAFKA